MNGILFFCRYNVINRIFCRVVRREGASKTVPDNASQEQSRKRWIITPVCCQEVLLGCVWSLNLRDCIDYPSTGFTLAGSLVCGGSCIHGRPMALLDMVTACWQEFTPFPAVVREG